MFPPKYIDVVDISKTSIYIDVDIDVSPNTNSMVEGFRGGVESS